MGLPHKKMNDLFTAVSKIHQIGKTVSAQSFGVSGKFSL